jgi:hypothetical protein
MDTEPDLESDESYPRKPKNPPVGGIIKAKNKPVQILALYLPHYPLTSRLLQIGLGMSLEILESHNLASKIRTQNLGNRKGRLVLNEYFL